MNNLTDRHRVLVVILVAASTVLAVAGITAGLLYQAAFEEERRRLVELAQSQARLAEAVARYEAGRFGLEHPQESPSSATIGQLAAAYKDYPGIGETGEFALVRRQADRIVFLLSRRLQDRGGPAPVAWTGEFAEPARRALKGQSGSLVGRDYRGVTVLAAHEPVAVLDLGLVAKIDLAEIRAPFVRAAAAGGFGALVLIALAGLLVRVVASPVLSRGAAEGELRAACADLQHRFDARTAQLREAQEALFRNERLAAMGQLTGTVAHELRNPLGAILSSVTVVRMKTADKGLDLERSLDRIDRSVDRCDRIVTELLDFARAKGLQPEPTALDLWLREVLGELDIPQGIALRQTLELQGIDLPVDREALRRAIVNVVDNACQAMTDEDGGTSRKQARFLTAATRLARGRIELEFTDTGPGIREEMLPRVLDPLFSTKRTGTGFGLPTVRQVMEDHGGGVEISSVVGLGTRVVLWLPLPQDGGGTDLRE